MRTIVMIHIFLLLFCFSSELKSQELELEFTNTATEYSKKYDIFKNEKGRGRKQYKRWESFWKPRLKGRIIETQISQISEVTHGEKWESLGPFIMPVNKLTYPSSGLGRINVIKPDPNHAGKIWVGAATGGLWKSEDAGAIWTYVPVDNLIYPGISDISIPKNNSDYIFLASGDANGYFMQGAVSSGVYYSKNKGETWHKSEIDFQPFQQGIITNISSNSDASQILFSSSKGIYLSEDTCETWEKVYSGFVRNMIRSNKDQNLIYAVDYKKNGGSSFIKSINGGLEWDTIKVFPTSSRMRIAQSESNPEILYLIGVDAQNNGLSGFYKSTDYGASWVEKHSIPNILGRDFEGNSNGGQAHYDLAITVHPDNPDIVFVGGIHVWESNDGGTNWEIKNYWIGKDDTPYMHADQHDLVFIDSVLYSANDGGVYISKDNGNSWKDISNGLNISQIYKIFVAKNYENLVLCGSQDNGAYHTDKWYNWFHIIGGDAMYSEVDPTSFSTWYIISNEGVLNKTVDFAKSFKVVLTPEMVEEQADWVTPFQINSINSSSLYIGYSNLWKTDDGGWTFRQISEIKDENNINLIEISKYDSTKVFYSTVTNLYEYDCETEKSERILENTDYAISAILSDSLHKNKIYVGFSGYNDTLKVIEYSAGKISNLSEGLPNFPVNDLLIYHGKIDFLFAATDVGVYYRAEYDNSWTRFGSKLPNLIITDLDIDIFNDRLIAASFGMGAWSCQLPTCKNENIRLFGDTVVCPNTNIILKSNLTIGKTIWSNGIISDSIEVSEPGKYWFVSLDDLLCVSFSDTLEVKKSELPTQVFIEDKDDSLLVSDGYKYTWFLNEEVLESENSFKILKRGKGFYQVLIEDQYGCSVLSEKYYLPVSIDQNEEDKLVSVVNTPITDILFLKIPEVHQNYRFEVYDSNGKYIDSFLQNNKYDMSAYPAGVYILRVICFDDIYTLRVVKI